MADSETLTTGSRHVTLAINVSYWSESGSSKSTANNVDYLRSLGQSPFVIKQITMLFRSRSRPNSPRTSFCNGTHFLKSVLSTTSMLYASQTFAQSARYRTGFCLAGQVRESAANRIVSSFLILRLITFLGGKFDAILPFKATEELLGVNGSFCELRM